MDKDQLRKQFIVDEDSLKTRLESLVTKALLHCRIDKNGVVLITDPKISAANQLRLVLAARAIASQLDDTISAEVSVSEIAASTGLPANQIRARGKEVIESKFAEAPTPGTYRAIPHKIEAYLDSIVPPKVQTK